MASDPSGSELTCRCGQVLDLAGATPGRVGQCPKCGRRFQVSEHAGGVAGSALGTPRPGLDPKLHAKSKSPKTTDLNEESSSGEGDSGSGYDLGPRHEVHRPKPALGFDSSEQQPEPSSGSSQSEGRARRDRDSWRSDAPRKKREPASDSEAEKVPAGPVGRGGLLPLPVEPESTVQGSLGYPIWDALGIACLVLIAPVMAVLSLIVFGAMPLVSQGGEMLVVGPITFGFGFIFALVTGYLLLLFEGMLVSSAQGDVCHPRWPDLDLLGAVVALLRWALAWGPPLLLVWFLTRSLHADAAENLGVRVVLGVLFALSGGLALVSVLAMAMHQDLGAALPQTVLPAAIRLGTGLLAPVLLLVALVTYTILGHAFLSWIGMSQGILILLLTTWVFWLLFLYMAMVVIRLVGQAYHGKFKEIGWFYREPKKVEVANSPPPKVDGPQPDARTTTVPNSEPIPVEDDGLGDW